MLQHQPQGRRVRATCKADSDAPGCHNQPRNQNHPPPPSRIFPTEGHSTFGSVVTIRQTRPLDSTLPRQTGRAYTPQKYTHTHNAEHSIYVSIHIHTYTQQQQPLTEKHRYSNTYTTPPVRRKQKLNSATQDRSYRTLQQLLYIVCKHNPAERYLTLKHTNTYTYNYINY